jgi:transcriptional regulator with XRE-family HTH domain
MAMRKSRKKVQIDLASIGRRIRELRGFDMTQVEFARRIRVAQGYLSALERGEKEPGAAVLLAISQEFEKSVDWLLTGKEPTWTTNSERYWEVRWIGWWSGREEPRPRWLNWARQSRHAKGSSSPEFVSFFLGWFRRIWERWNQIAVAADYLEAMLLALWEKGDSTDGKEKAKKK